MEENAAYWLEEYQKLEQLEAELREKPESAMILIDDVPLVDPLPAIKDRKREAWQRYIQAREQNMEKSVGQLAKEWEEAKKRREKYEAQYLSASWELSSKIQPKPITPEAIEEMERLQKEEDSAGQAFRAATQANTKAN